MTDIPTRPGPGPEAAGTRRHRAAVAAVAAAVGCLFAGACTTAPTAGTAAGGRTVVDVVAAENFWGSIVSQIGGSHAHVTSVITDPNTDPHSYEPTAVDAKAIAEAQLVVENGVGYDPWVPKLLAANQTNPAVLDVGRLLGVPDGGNPHRWYNPGDVRRVVAAAASDLQRLDPADRSYFAHQATVFETVDLRQYDATITAIKATYAGTPVGASESIFAMLAPSLGLNLVTPPSFLRAVSEGTEVSAGDKETIDRQIATHAIKIYVYNSQNVTPDVQTQLAEVRSAHIPVATITETLAPASATFESWQTRQLVGIERALAASRRG